MFKKGNIPWNEGIQHTEEVKRKISNSHKGKSYNIGVKHSKERVLKNSNSHKGKKPSMETRLKLSKSRKGSNNPNWKGGITSLVDILRHSIEYKLWRKAVFERDNYMCVWCGNKQKSGNPVILEADHIQEFSLYPELRFAIDNGRTLCKICHTSRHKRSI